MRIKGVKFTHGSFHTPDGKPYSEQEMLHVIAELLHNGHITLGTAETLASYVVFRAAFPKAK